METAPTLETTTQFRILNKIFLFLHLFILLIMASTTSVPLQGGSDESIGDLATFGVLTISDRASAGIYKDESGPAILNFFQEAIKSK